MILPKQPWSASWPRWPTAMGVLPIESKCPWKGVLTLKAAGMPPPVKRKEDALDAKKQ